MGIGPTGPTWEQGWRSSETTRLPPMWPTFRFWCRRHMWAKFVVGSLPCSERFISGYSGSQPTLPNFIIRSGTHGHVSASSYELLSARWVNKLQYGKVTIRHTTSENEWN